MTPPPAPPEIIAQWMGYARADLALAERSDQSDFLIDLLCFHAQQAVEKSLKAVLHTRTSDIPYTHSIATLLGLLREHDIDFPERLAQSAKLTQFATLTRYPRFGRMPTPSDDYNAAIALAQLAVSWAESQVRLSGIPQAKDAGST